ncbi:MAG TPA: 3-dehydroquinate synthase [Vicinamibacterales bacterium]|nr:3-dehydroquinate synthase [Vicinamibacterales bacterium]
MDVIRQQFQVAFHYPVYFTRDLFVSSNPVFRTAVQPTQPGRAARLLFVVDHGVAAAHPSLIEALTAYCRAHADALEMAAAPVVIPGGEHAKNDPAVVPQVIDAIHDAALCRHSYVVAVGGGAVLDVAGYAAGIVHRGVRLIRVPTTVLAQDDSGMGVKNGVNLFGQKNYLGSFAPPFAVLNDFAFLTTLTDRDWRAGLAEAVKVALIRDPALFDYLESHAGDLAGRDMAAMEHVIRRSAALHLAHIAEGGDPFELGSSRPLDFGHWAAHKLEGLTRHRLRHGEAVAIGIALDTTYSHLTGSLSEQEWRRILDLLTALRLPIYHPQLSRRLDAVGDPSCVLAGLDEFREHLGGELTIMLLRGIGRPFDAHEIHRDIVRQSVERLRTQGRSTGEEEDAYDYPISIERHGTGG